MGQPVQPVRTGTTKKRRKEDETTQPHEGYPTQVQRRKVKHGIGIAMRISSDIVMDHILRQPEILMFSWLQNLSDIILYHN